jgi:hypothetical protein
VDLLGFPAPTLLAYFCPWLLLLLLLLLLLILSPSAGWSKLALLEWRLLLSSLRRAYL